MCECAGALSSFAKARRTCPLGAAGGAAPSAPGARAWPADVVGPSAAPFSCRTLALLLDSRRRRVLTQTLQARLRRTRCAVQAATPPCMSTPATGTPPLPGKRPPSTKQHSERCPRKERVRWRPVRVR